MKRKKIVKIVKKLAHTPFGKVLKVINEIIAFTQANLLNFIWRLSGSERLTNEEVEDVRESVTFTFKSFERQRLAKKLYKSIQSYYQGDVVYIREKMRKGTYL